MGVPITTGESFEGFKITEYLGIVRGIVARRRLLNVSLGTALSMTSTEAEAALAAQAETSRQAAHDAMVAKAREAGANGVIGVRYDTCEMTETHLEITCYGTAVRVEKAS
jgi:uncharacterized protein YbjQ (UPF0145 family)